MKTYQLRYYDILDGEVNDTRLFGNVDIVTTKTTYNEGLPGEFTEDEPIDDFIIIALKSCGFLNKKAKTQDFEFDGDNECIYIQRDDTGEPVCELLPVK